MKFNNIWEVFDYFSCDNIGDKGSVQKRTQKVKNYDPGLTDQNDFQNHKYDKFGNLISTKYNAFGVRNNDYYYTQNNHYFLHQKHYI